MMRTWTLRAVLALSVVAAAPAAWAAPEPPTTTDDKLNAVLAQLQQLNTRLAALQLNQDIQIKAVQDDVSRLKDDMRNLQDEVRRLTAGSVQPNVAASINPNQPVAPGGALVNGTITLENRYSSPATVVVNGQSYRLVPGERVDIAAPAGRFTYAVLTDNYGLVQGTTSRYLAPGRDFPITINP